MSRMPYMQFYPGDWLRDPALGMCRTATRGVWMDLICAMHQYGQGEIRGTSGQLARVARCTPEELEDALQDLAATGAAEVTKLPEGESAQNLRTGTFEVSRDCPVVFLVVSRRMRRDVTAREYERSKKHRQRTAPENAACPGNVPALSRDCPGVYSVSDIITATARDRDNAGTGQGQHGGGGGGFDSEEPKPQAPPEPLPPDQERAQADSEPQAAAAVAVVEPDPGEERWQALERELPEIARRGIGRAAVERLLSDKNGSSATWLAVLAEACADPAVRSPLAVTPMRVKSGARPETIARARRALGLAKTAATKRVVEAPRPPPPKRSRASYLAEAADWDAKGNPALASQARRLAEGAS